MSAVDQKPTAVPTGNTYDKYGSANPVVKRLMTGFHAALDELWEIAKPQSVLDVGCGEGVLTSEWAERLGGGRIVGIVLSPQWSPLIMGGYIRAVDAARDAIGPTAPPVVMAEAWHLQPAKVWSLESGDCVRTLAGSESASPELAISPDGRLVLCVVSQRWTKAALAGWDLETGERIHELEGQAAQISDLSLTADGELVLANCGDEGKPAIRIWDIRSGACLRSLATSDVNRLAVTREAKLSPGQVRTGSPPQSASLPVVCEV